MKDDNILARERVSRLIIRLAVPTVLAQLVNLLYNIMDRVYVGRIAGVGSLALAGLGVTFPIIMLVSAFASLMGMGGAPRAAIAMGKGDNDGAEKILGNSVCLLTVTALVLSVIFMLTRNKILLAFGASENTLRYASEYISVYLIGTVFVQLSLGLNMFITNQGFGKTSMATVCIGAVLNIVLDPIFIFGLNMGVRGAALATVISQAVSCAWVIMFLTGKRTIIKIRPKNLRLNAGIVKLILSLGISPFVMQTTECLIQLTFNTGMLKYGNDMYVALMSIFFSITQLIWMPVQGLSQGAAPVISYNYGAGNTERVKRAFFLLFTASLVFSFAVIAVLEMFPQLFIGIFTDDGELIALGKNALRLFMAGMSLMGMQSACQQTFLALGEAKVSAFLAAERKLMLLLPLALILPRAADLGVWGLFLAEPVSDIIAVCTTVGMFKHKSRVFFGEKPSRRLAQ